MVSSVESGSALVKTVRSVHWIYRWAASGTLARKRNAGGTVEVEACEWVEEWMGGEEVEIVPV